MTGLLKDKTILIVDDDADTLVLLTAVLEDAGADVIAANSVEAALETYRQSPPHAVVADIRLGSSDGYALIKVIRETDLEYRGFTAAVALTGFASPEDRKRALTVGFNAYITKPFDPADVIDQLHDLLSRSRDSAA
jgi:CheY-like chemotaxis protein